MKLTIKRMIEKTETIDIEFPYYYKYDLLLDETDSVIYGKIEEHQVTMIQLTFRHDGYSSYELEIDKKPATHFACYMTDKYKSDENEYLQAMAKMTAAIQGALRGVKLMKEEPTEC
jgi:hypothetical protein